MAVRRSARLSAAADTSRTAESTPSELSRKTKKGTNKSGSIAKSISKRSKTPSASTRTSKLKDTLPFDRAEQTSELKPEEANVPNSEEVINGATAHDVDRGSTPTLDRPVEPHRTNVALLTPHGSSKVAYEPGTQDASPTKTGLPRPIATTTNLLDKAIAHLIAADPRLQPIIERHPCDLFSPERLSKAVDPFEELASSIISQQVSGAAARSIRNKFVALFEPDEPDEPDGKMRQSRFPRPAEVATVEIPVLRTAGLSQRKAEYIHGLADKFASGELSTDMLLRADDDELMEKLTAVRGLGRWSVEMFACFALKRTDVFSTGDLGVQRGCATFIGRDVNKLKSKGGGKFKYMPEKDMLELAEKFRPYRSLFMWYMWRVENVDITVLNN